MAASHLRYVCSVLGVLALASAQAWAEDPTDHPVSLNLHRVRSLLDGDARAVWIGDSWCRLNHVARLPFGALCTWPIEDVSAVCLGYKGGGGLGRAFNYTDGPGSMVEVNALNGWTVEINGGTPAHFALPVNDLTKIFGDPSLELTGSGGNTGRIQALGVNNVRFAQTDHGPFAQAGDRFRARMLYYAPADLLDMLPSVVLGDFSGTTRAVADLRARPARSGIPARIPTWIRRVRRRPRRSTRWRATSCLRSRSRAGRAW